MNAALLCRYPDKNQAEVDLVIAKGQAGLASQLAWQPRDQKVYLAANWNWRGRFASDVICPNSLPPGPVPHPLAAVGTFGDENCFLLATL